MATNPPSGDGHRNGAVKDRSQTFNPVTKQWVKRDSDTGHFMDVKKMALLLRESAKKSKSRDRESEAGFPAPLFLLLQIFSKGGNHGQILVLREEYQPAAGH